VFSLNMLLNTDAGRCYALSEIESFLKEAGFERLQPIEPGVLMDAKKAGAARLAIDMPRQPKEKQAKKPEPAKSAPGEKKPEPAPAEPVAEAEAPASEAAAPEAPATESPAAEATTTSSDSGTS